MLTPKTQGDNPRTGQFNKRKTLHYLKGKTHDLLVKRNYPPSCHAL